MGCITHLRGYGRNEAEKLALDRREGTTYGLFNPGVADDARSVARLARTR